MTCLSAGPGGRNFTAEGGPRRSETCRCTFTHLIVHRHELIARSSGQRVEGPPSRVDLRLIRK